MWCGMPEQAVSKSCQGFALSSLVFILKARGTNEMFSARARGGEGVGKR